MKSFINCELWRRQTHKACCTAADVCQNKKENMSRPSSSSPQYQNNIIFMFARLYKTANVLRVSPFLRRRLLFYYLLRCHAAIQRDRDLCDLYRLCFGNWLCAFSFCLHISFQPAKNKSSLGSKIIPMYSSVTFQLQQCSARDACHMQFFLSFHLAVRHFIVHGKQRSFDELTRHDIDGSLLPNNIVE